MTLSTDVWFPVVTLILGSLLGLVADHLRSKRETQKALAQKERDRVIAMAVEQRALMLELLTAVNDFARTIWLCHIEDKKYHLGGGEWGKNQLGESINQKIFEDSKRVSTLNVRLLEPELRAKIEGLGSIHANHALAASEEEAEALLKDMTALVDDLQMALGQAVRTLDVATFGPTAKMVNVLGVKT